MLSCKLTIASTHYCIYTPVTFLAYITTITSIHRSHFCLYHHYHIHTPVSISAYITTIASTQSSHQRLFDTICLTAHKLCQQNAQPRSTLVLPPKTDVLCTRISA